MATRTRTVKWDKAGVTLEIASVDKRLRKKWVELLCIRKFDASGRLVEFRHDFRACIRSFAPLVIKSWTGVGSPCTPENIAAFMRIEQAQDFVFEAVTGSTIERAQGELAASMSAITRRNEALLKAKYPLANSTRQSHRLF